MNFIRGKNKQNAAAKQEASNIFDRHSMMISHIADYEQGITNYPESWRFAEWSPSIGADGNPNGLTKTTKYADGTPTKYEFLVYKGLNQSGQINTQYYDVTPSGNFANSRGLAIFNLKYNALVNGQYIPCETTVRTDGASSNFVTISPRDVVPMAEVDTEACIPDAEDVKQIIREYARVNNIAIDEFRNQSGPIDELFSGAPGRTNE